jgi:hypothetical protein
MIFYSRNLAQREVEARYLYCKGPGEQKTDQRSLMINRNVVKHKLLSGAREKAFSENL